MKIFKFLILISLILVKTTIYPQNKQDNIIVLDNNVEKISINNIKILIDESNNFSIENIVSADFSDQFTDFNNKSIPFFKNKYTYWIRLHIKKTTDYNVEWFLTDKIFPVYEKMEVYLENDNRLIKINEYTKYNNKFYKLDIEKNNLYTIYLKYSYVNILFDLKIVSLKIFLQDSIFNHLFFGLFIGIILIMTLYNLYIFVSFKDKSFLYFSLFTLILSISQLIAYGVFNELAFNINGMDIIYSVLRNLSVIFYALYVINFLSLHEKSPMMNIFFISSIIFLAIITIITPFYYILNNDSFLIIPFKISYIISMLDYAAIFVTSFIISILLWLRGNKHVKYFIIAASSIIFAVMIYSIAGFSSILLSYLWDLKIIDYAILIMIILFSLASANKISLTRKEKEDAQKQIIDNLLWIKKISESNDSLNKAYELKTQLMNMAAHDLKNPLTIISGGINVLKKRMNFDKEDEMFVELINKSTIKMNLLISELLEDSMIEDGRIRLEMEDVDLSDIMRNLIANYKMQLNQKNQTVIFNKNHHKFLTRADKSRMTEIFDNLISNAIKYSPMNKKIRIYFDKINNVHQAECTVIKVEDEGPGLSDSDKTRIFQKFQRLSARPTGDEISTGLGLYITRYLVELHNGKIKVESEYGKGSVFIIELPIVDK